MSAYLVSDDTYNALYRYMVEDRPDIVEFHLAPRFELGARNFVEICRLANHKALNARYGDPMPKPGDLAPITHRNAKPMDATSALNALESIDYQCSEHWDGAENFLTFLRNVVRPLFVDGVNRKKAEVAETRVSAPIPTSRPVPSTTELKLNRYGRPKTTAGRATVFGVENVAVQVRYVDARKPNETGPVRWEVSESFGLTVPALAKLLQKLGDDVRIRHTSEFDGMIDGSRQIDHLVPLDGFLSWLQPEKGGFGFSRNTGGIYFAEGDRSIHVFDACDSYRIEWAKEIERRESVLEDRPLPMLHTEPGQDRFVRDVLEARTRHLNALDPMAWDEAHENLCGHGMNDPMEVIRLINPAWHAQLLANTEKRAA